MRKRFPCLVVCLGVLGLASSAVAENISEIERPRGGYVVVDPPDGTAEGHNSKILFLNPCWGGCTIFRGFPDSSINNRSSIVGGTVTVSQFGAGQATWDAVVACVTSIYEPFDVDIVDVDPGGVNHFEAIVAGRPGDIGAGDNVGGVAPFSCSVINNAITFTFANIYGGAVRAICETVAQESAHAFGLDHELYCPDPMTYLGGCGNKEFRDVNAQCGEFSASSCACSGATQNSFQHILGIFGPGTPTPPSVKITEPQDGAQVSPGFVVRADISDNVEVVSAALWVNSQQVLELTSQPFVFNAPSDLSDGVQFVEIRATDNTGTIGKDTISVIQGEPCGGSDDCGELEICIEGRCVPGPDAPGGAGTTCTSGDECASGQCANDGTNSYCVENCEDRCPEGFGCINAGDVNVCWPGAENPPSGGCNVGGGAGTAALILLAFGFILIGRRRS